MTQTLTTTRDLERFVSTGAKNLLFASRMLELKDDEYLLLSLLPGRAPSMFDLDSAAKYAELQQYDVVLTTGPLPQPHQRVTWTVRARSTGSLFSQHFGAVNNQNKGRCLIVQLGRNGHWIGSKGFMASSSKKPTEKTKKTKKTKPNAKCPCGSDKKYKKCCNTGL